MIVTEFVIRNEHGTAVCGALASKEDAEKECARRNRTVTWGLFNAYHVIPSTYIVKTI